VTGGAVRRTAIVTSALLAAAAPLAAGCAGPGSPGTPAGAGLAVTGPVRSAVPGPFAQAMLTESGPDTVATAELGNAAELLTQRCMRTRHLRYYPELSPAAAGQDDLFYPPYGTLAQRRATGYGIVARAAPGGPAGVAVSAEDSYRRHLPAAQQAGYTTALFGPQSRYVKVAEPGGLVVDTPGAGCAAGAGRDLFGSVTAESQVITGATLLSGFFRNAVEKEPGYVRAMRRWSACMSTRGYRFPDPYAAYDFIGSKVRGRGAGPAVKRLEIAIAVADFQCAGTVRLTAGIAQAENQVLGHLSRRFEGDVLRDAAAIQAALSRAGTLAPGSVRRRP
jgi:hypothetical protein